MPIAQSLIGEFDHEMANTRKTLERVPDEKFNWKPHPKSMSLGALAGHIAFIPHWAKITIDTAQFDPMPEGQPVVRPPELKTRAEVLAFFDKNVPEARAAIAGASDEVLMAPWSFTRQGRPVFTMPRVGVLRAMIFSHTIHHRAQLGVYLRLNDIAVPALYGPSADEQPGM